MAKTIKARNLSLALRYIVDNFGKNTLLNPGKVESFHPPSRAHRIPGNAA